MDFCAILFSNKSNGLGEKMAIHIDVSKLDKLILLINNSVDEKEKHRLLGKASEIYGRGGQPMTPFFFIDIKCHH